LKKQGLSILLSEQNIYFARMVADRVYVLEKGQIHWEGSVAELDTNLEVQRTYLTV
jgi:branched-chain amino acid transport system ATP-binding protein